MPELQRHAQSHPGSNVKDRLPSRFTVRSDAHSTHFVDGRDARAQRRQQGDALPPSWPSRAKEAIQAGIAMAAGCLTSRFRMWAHEGAHFRDAARLARPSAAQKFRDLD
eukprot:5643594-Pyramimonas_sp.AAC.1